MMMMIGHLNASHTGVSGRGPTARRQVQTRYPGFDLVADPSGYYRVGRDAGFQQPRPQNFYGPMMVMQNERAASDAEMLPAGFKALGLGQVVGVPMMGAVIGTGSYTLLDGSAIRTRAAACGPSTAGTWRTTGVPPDVLVDNTPADFLKERDAQIEKAVEVLKGQMTTRKTTTSSQR
jgi:C-terminal processing protease CtpA/Prc